MDTPFLGTSYRTRSATENVEELINLYPEISETKIGAEVGAFYGTPGLDLIATVGTGPIRGMLPFNGSLYIVSNTGVYIVSSAFNVTLLGSIATGSGQVSMIANLTQVAIFDGQKGYVINNGALSAINLPFANPGTAIYQDGYGLVNQIGTSNIWQSNINDLTTWNALAFGVETGTLGTIVGIAEIHRQMYVFKTTSSFVWVNAGLTPFAFQRLEGVSLEIGCAAVNSITNVSDTLCWLSANSEGQGIVYVINGYQPERLSTYAMEYQIAKYPTISDAIGYSYQQEGHIFYQLTFPSGNETWVCDMTASKALGYPAWHKRLAWSNGQFSRHQTATSAFFAQRVLVGDAQSGNVYAYNLDTFTDNGKPRKWLRRWRALPKAVSRPFRLNYLEILMETGTGTGEVVFRQSEDANSWSGERFENIGALGETSHRVKFRRLGMNRRGLGTDTIFELSSTDPFKVALMGAELG
jgi:hypothetical protein